MSKPCKILDPQTPSSSVTPTYFDWQECIFCQERTLESLQCPANSKRSDVEVGTGYKTFAITFQRCKSIDWFPIKIKFEDVIDEKGLAYNLQLRNAKWHNNCRNKFSDLKIERHEKQKRKGDMTDYQDETASKLTSWQRNENYDQ